MYQLSFDGIKVIWRHKRRHVPPLAIPIFRTPPLENQAVRKGAEKFELHTPSADWSTEAYLPCDGDKKQHTHFWTTAKA